MKKEITTSIEIQAPKEAVWKVLTDFEQFPEWNPFVQSLKGEVVEGRQIIVKLPGMTFKPVVQCFVKNSEFRWLGHLGFKGLFDGEHRFLLTEQSNGSTLFQHSERFSGILVALFARSLDNDTKSGFEQMNKALKQRVEAMFKIQSA